MKHDCGETMEYLGDEDDGSPIYKCKGCNVTVIGEKNYEQIVSRARLLRV